MKQKHLYVYFESYLEYKTLKISSLCYTKQLHLVLCNIIKRENSKAEDLIVKLN